jgi:hypothetical protein
MDSWEEPHPGRRLHLPALAGHAGSSSRNMPFCKPAASWSTTEFQQPCHDRPCPLLGHLRSYRLYRGRASPRVFVGRRGIRPCDASSTRRPGSLVEFVPSTARTEEAADCESIEMGAISRSISEGNGTATDSSKPSFFVEPNRFCNGSERVVQREFNVQEGDSRAASAVWERADPYDDVHGWEAEFERRLHMGSLEAKGRKNCKLSLRAFH